MTGVPAGFNDGTDDNTLGTLSCANGQVAKRSGATWACAADDNTTYTAGSGLILGGTQFSVNFGTGANTVAAGNHTHGGQQWAVSTSYGLFVNDTALNGTAIIGTASGGGPGAVGVAGGSGNGVGVLGSSTASFGMKGLSADPSSIAPRIAGVWGDSHSKAGVIGTSDDDFGVHGQSTNATGVRGESGSGAGVHGSSVDYDAVRGESAGSERSGVYGVNSHADGDGVFGRNSNRGTTGYLGGDYGARGAFGHYAGYLGTNQSAVLGTDEQTHNYGVLGGGANAGYFSGKVQVDGDLSVLAGHSKTFKIDHPLDAANKYLYHFSVESNDVTNLYHGIVVLDDHGEAEVAMPPWFEAIKVVGIRNYPSIRRHSHTVEEDKPPEEQGAYLDPEAYGQPAEKSVQWARHPEVMRAGCRRRTRAPHTRTSDGSTTMPNEERP